MPYFESIETERLIIREYQNGDAQDRADLMREGFESAYTLPQHRAWLDWTIASYREHAGMYQPMYGDYAVALRSTGELIGSVGLVPTVVPWAVLPDWRPDGEATHAFVWAEFGMFWAIRNAHTGKGFAPEAASAFMNEFMFERMRVRRAVATTERDNLNSQRVMQKIGMMVYENPTSEPHWFQVVGVANNPALNANAV